MRKKVWRKKFAAIAARDRQFTVKNNTVPKSDKEYFMIPWSSKNTDTTGNYWFVSGVPGAMFIKNDKPDPKTGNHYTPVDHSWKPKKSPQPKRLHKKFKKKYYYKGTRILRKIIVHPSDYTTYTKALLIGDKVYTEGVFKPHFPKMNHVEYMEKLTQHKLAKWERKNPKPLDMFTEEVEKWKQQRATAEERLRDFVVSIYDKLPLIGRFEQKKDGMATYQEKKVADLKDENGDGHRVNEISIDSKLVKKAQQVTNKVHAKHANLICTNLKDHKRQKGRIILPQAA